VPLSVSIPLFAFVVVVLPPLAFMEHPGPDVGGTAQHGNSFRLARIQKANRLDIGEVHFLQVQNNWWCAQVEFGLHLMHMLRSKFTAKPHAISNPVNPERHPFSAELR
jgi:hypothetical protein